MASKSKKKKQPAKMTVFGTSPMSSRGQIVVPAKLRKAHNIKPGDTLIFTGNPEAGHFHVLNASSFKGFTEDLSNLLFEGNKKITEKKGKKKVASPKQKPKG
jgi:AbrB family looped-hinge helix DNA binding protein